MPANALTKAKVQSMLRMAPHRPGLGDRVASSLAAVGITKERVSAMLGDCGCEQRQQWLNEVGHRLGIGRPTPHTTGNPPRTGATAP